MSETRVFEIPENDQGAMVKLIKAVPSDWSWIDGFLEAPRQLIELEEALFSTGFEISRYQTSQNIIGRKVEDGTINPDYYGILAERKRPGFVVFHEAGYQNRRLDFETAQKIAAEFVRKGYRGWLHFFSGCYDNSKYDNPEDCEIRLLPHNGKLPNQQDRWARVDLPPLIIVSWDAKCRGKVENVASLLGACNSLGLEEIKPGVAPTT